MKSGVRMARSEDESHDNAGKASVIVASAPTRQKRGNGKSATSKRETTLWSSPSNVIALLVALAAAYLVLSLLLALKWPQGWAFLNGLGKQILIRFSWAGFFLPLWLACAAVLIVLPKFYPRLTYFLGASALPFLVLTAFARLSTEPGAFFENHPVFAAVGLSSLYAGVGFLFALSLVLVFLGYAKLNEWLNLKENGGAKGAVAAKSETSARKTKAIQKRESLFVRAKLRLQQWFADWRGKRTKAEKQLREAQALAANSFDFDLPTLKPVGAMKSLNSEYEGSLGSATDPKPVTPPDREFSSSIAPSSQTAAAQASMRTSASSGPSAPVSPSPKPENPAGLVQTKLDANGKEIEFTSVPPQAVAEGYGNDPGADDSHKQDIIKKILERKALKPYTVPVDGILNTYPDGQYWIIDDKTRRNAEVLRETLAEFNIEAEVTGIRKGPVITMFEILPAHGVKISKITNLSDNIALRLAASSVRIVAPIPGKHAVGIEVPNDRRAIVSLREIIEHEQFKSAKMEIPVALGKDIAGEVQFIDLTQTPHLLIAGATGSGKSVCVNAIILSVLYRRSPEEVKLLLIDPKIVELKLYNDIPHLLTPVVTESKRAFQALQYCICEMERRYSMLDKAGVRDIRSFNRKIKEKGLAQEKLPYIVVIIDEFADLMAQTGKELESTLARLAAMSRAVGIHLVLATQRPSIDVITGLIKANIPSRIAFMVASKFDSRIIIDMVGAEKLLGRGDMLFSGAQDPFPVRMQGAFVSEEEVERAVEHVKTLGEPEYIDDEIFYDEDEENAEPGLFDDGDGDPLFEKALEIVLQQGKASASFIQRRLKIGYNRAARLVELMEERGIVGPAQGSKPRDVMRNPGVTGSRPPLLDSIDSDDSAGNA